MNRSYRILWAAALLLVVMASPLMAQTAASGTVFTQLSDPQSNKAAATGGIFSTDVDNYMDLQAWKDLDFSNWLGYAGYGFSTELDNLGNLDDPDALHGVLKLGYGRRIGPVYLGAYYSGFMVENNQLKEETLTTTYNDGTSQGFDSIQREETTVKYTGTAFRTLNEASVMAGFSGMGLKLGFMEDLTSYSRPDNFTSSVVESSEGMIRKMTNSIRGYDELRGIMIPSLKWGTNLKIKNLVIKPNLGMALSINQNHRDLETESATELNGVKLDATQYSRNGMMADLFRPALTAGAALVFPSASDRHLEASLSYTAEFDLADNKYDIYGISGSSNGAVQWTNGSYSLSNDGTKKIEIRSADLAIEENTYLAHFIDPKFTWTYDFNDRTSMGVVANAQVGIASRVTEGRTEKVTNTDITSGSYDPTANREKSLRILSYDPKVEQNVLQIVPVATAGVTHQIIPQRLEVSGSLTAAFPSYYHEVTRTYAQKIGYTVTKEKDGAGNILEDTKLPNESAPIQRTESRTVNDRWTNLQGAVSGGFTFYFTPGFAVDTVFSSGRLNLTPANMPIPGLGSIADPGLIDMSSVKIQFSLKF